MIIMLDEEPLDENNSDKSILKQIFDLLNPKTAEDFTEDQTDENSSKKKRIFL